MLLETPGLLPTFPPSPLPQKDAHQLRQDGQEDDDGGRVAGKLGEEDDDRGDDQDGQHGRHVLQRVQLVTDPYGQPGLLRGEARGISSHRGPPGLPPPKGGAQAGGLEPITVTTTVLPPRRKV